MSTPYNPFSAQPPHASQGGYPQYTNQPQYTPQPQPQYTPAAQPSAAYAPYNPNAGLEGRSPVWPKLGVIALFLLILGSTFLPMMIAKMTTEDLANEYGVSSLMLPEGVDADGYVGLTLNWWGHVEFDAVGFDEDALGYDIEAAEEEQRQELVEDEDFQTLISVISGGVIVVLVLAGLAVICVLFNNRLSALPGILAALAQMAGTGLIFFFISVAPEMEENLTVTPGTGLWLFLAASVGGFIFYIVVLVAGGKKYPAVQPPQAGTPYPSAY